MIKNCILILFFEISEFFNNLFEFVRSTVSIKSYIISNTTKLSKYYQFNKKNLSYLAKTKKYIIIDCFFDSSWIISNSILASELSKKYDLELATYNSQPYSYRRNPLLNKIFNSFGCKKHFNVSLNFKNKIKRMKIFLKNIDQINSRSDLYNFKINDVWIGVEIYESILRNNQLPTVNVKKLITKKNIYKAIKYFIYFEELYKNKKIAALLISHDTYIQTGIPMKLAFKYKIPVYCANAREIIQLEKPHQLYFRFNKYKIYFDNLEDNEKKIGINFAKNNLEKRLNGQLNVDMPHQEKSAFEDKKIIRQTNNNDKFKVLIATHCFFDNPHCFGGLLFNDFYEWLEYLSNISYKVDYEWYIKPHRDYLQGTLETLKTFESKFSNVKIIDPETSFHQLKDEGVKHVLTAYGSVGHELPLLGFQVVNAGYNPHINFNFNKHCFTIKEYDQTILNLKKININIDEKEIYKFFYVNHFVLNGDMYSHKIDNKTFKINENLNFLEYIYSFVDNINFYKNFKKKLTQFENFNSIYPWEYKYKDIKSFKFENKNNHIN